MRRYEQAKSKITAGIIGSLDFQSRFSSIISSNNLITSSFGCSSLEGWSQVLGTRPNCLIFEIGLNYSQKDHAWLKDFLAQLRNRFKNEIYIVVALLAPEKLFYGGDLLFKDGNDGEPSCLVDTFIAQPPAGFSDVPSIESQLIQCLSLISYEVERRDSGLPPTPPLAADGWVHSLADPQSRELWMLWLPRYASYTNDNPIITGPTGAGKTRLAKALHILSGRTGPFVSITPRDFSSSELVQAELFGAVAGAYTGAVDKWGLVKSAENGTLFIDELQSIDKDLQGKLITFIENKSYRRVGSAETIQANVRFVFATNRTISEMVRTDTLRDDFAYRLERVQLNLAALNHRRLDITAGLAYSLAKIRRQRPQASHIFGISSDAYRLLFGYNWPGNLRQLENAVAKLCELADISGKAVIEDDIVREVFDTKLDFLPTNTAELVSSAAQRLTKSALSQKVSTLEDGAIALRNEARAIALELSNGDPGKAAKILGENRNVLDIFLSARIAKDQLDSRLK
ncbi:MAG: sigma 54-interacting transcriptional regulator [bacterium]|nr:sigma 54-interacting transcriptional regulator [bacterium]